VAAGRYSPAAAARSGIEKARGSLIFRAYSTQRFGSGFNGSIITHP
jgi:hypothetical protein